MKLPPANRIAVYLTGAAGLLEGVGLVLAQADLSTTIGAVSAFLGVVKVVDKWLDGWQEHEKAQRQLEVQRAHTRHLRLAHGIDHA